MNGSFNFYCCAKIFTWGGCLHPSLIHFGFLWDIFLDVFSKIVEKVKKFRTLFSGLRTPPQEHPHPKIFSPIRLKRRTTLPRSSFFRTKIQIFSFSFATGEEESKAREKTAKPFFVPILFFCKNITEKIRERGSWKSMPSSPPVNNPSSSSSSASGA